MTQPPDLGKRGGQALRGSDGRKLRDSIRQRTPLGSELIATRETPTGVELSVKLSPKVLEEFDPPIGPLSPQWPSWLDGSTGGLHTLLLTSGDTVGSTSGDLLRAGTDEVNFTEWPYAGSTWITGATEPSPIESATGPEWALRWIASGMVIEGTVGEDWTSADWEAAWREGKFRPALLVNLACYVPLLDGWEDSIRSADCLTDRPQGKTAKVYAGGDWIDWLCLEADQAWLECALIAPLQPDGAVARGAVPVPPEMLAHCDPATVLAVSVHVPGGLATAAVSGGACEVIAAPPQHPRAPLAATVRLAGMRRGMPEAWPRTTAAVAAANAAHYRRAH